MSRLAVALVLLPFALNSFAETRLDGEFIQGSLVIGSTDPGNKAEFDGREIRVSETGIFLIGFNRDEAERVSLVVTQPDGTVEDRVINVAARQYEIDKVCKVAGGDRRQRELRTGRRFEHQSTKPDHRRAGTELFG